MQTVFCRFKLSEISVISAAESGAARRSFTTEKVSGTVFAVKFSALEWRHTMSEFTSRTIKVRRLVYSVSGFDIASCLCGEQLVIFTLLIHQLCVSTAFDELTVFKNEDLISSSSAGKSVGYEDRCFILSELVETIEYLLLSHRVK